MSAGDLLAVRAEFAAAGWIIEFHETAAGDYWSATLPGRQVRADSAKRLRERIADTSRSRVPTDHTARAVAAIGDALIAEPDLGGWLAGVLCRVAAAAGGSHALVSGRPGSWESGYVLALVRGTAGHADEDLAGWRDA